ncbi:hypothetical protein FP359_23210 [Klebsiella variicola]|uniref:hypothetical protein n=1 Tax=Klebsiella TaxID=570 RepID=UPI0012B959C3|nr:hypothetical protein [Klebsiella variicola]MBD0721909.1 hypothetical protein [Klebsiella variicola]MBY5172757.1 hypothetical protein [Klebsiella variicola]
MNTPNTPPTGVVIDEAVWQHMVTYLPAPECETERLHRLVSHALRTMAATPRHDAASGLFCLPGDGSMSSPLWHRLSLSVRDGLLHIRLAD